MEMYGNVGECKEMTGNVGKCVEVSENVWKCLEMGGNMWKYVEIPGNAWKCVEMHGNVRKCKESTRKSWNSMEFWKYKGYISGFLSGIRDSRNSTQFSRIPSFSGPVEND